MCVDTHTHTHAHAPPAQAGKAPFLCHRLAEANLSPRPAPVATRDGHPSLKLFPPFWGLSRAVHTSLLAGLVADLPLLAGLVALACHPPRGHLQPSSGQLLLCFFFFFYCFLIPHPQPPGFLRGRSTSHLLTALPVGFPAYEGNFSENYF